MWKTTSPCWRCEHCRSTRPASRCGCRRDQPSLSQFRQTLRRWLATAGLPPDVAYEITTACNEACANAIEHAYGPGDATFSFEASVANDKLAVTVRDTGRWRPPDAFHRGLGLTVMRALMEVVNVDSGPGGTTVQMERRVITKVRV